jgi:hypothetical protein
MVLCLPYHSRSRRFLAYETSTEVLVYTSYNNRLSTTAFVCLPPLTPHLSRQVLFQFSRRLYLDSQLLTVQ